MPLQRCFTIKPLCLCVFFFLFFFLEPRVQLAAGAAVTPDGQPGAMRGKESERAATFNPHPGRLAVFAVREYTSTQKSRSPPSCRTARFKNEMTWKDEKKSKMRLKEILRAYAGHEKHKRSTQRD